MGAKSIASLGKSSPNLVQKLSSPMVVPTGESPGGGNDNLNTSGMEGGALSSNEMGSTFGGGQQPSGSANAGPNNHRSNPDATMNTLVPGVGAISFMGVTEDETKIVCGTDTGFLMCYDCGDFIRDTKAEVARLEREEAIIAATAKMGRNVPTLGVGGATSSEENGSSSGGAPVIGDGINMIFSIFFFLDYPLDINLAAVTAIDTISQIRRRYPKTTLAPACWLQSQSALAPPQSSRRSDRDDGVCTFQFVVDVRYRFGCENVADPRWTSYGIVDARRI